MATDATLIAGMNTRGGMKGILKEAEGEILAFRGRPTGRGDWGMGSPRGVEGRNGGMVGEVAEREEDEEGELRWGDGEMCGVEGEKREAWGFGVPRMLTGGESPDREIFGSAIRKVEPFPTSDSK